MSLLFRRPDRAPDQARSRRLRLAVLLVLQGMCAGYFGIEVITELALAGASAHTMTESAATSILFISLGFTLLELRRAMGRFDRVESSLRIAAGAFREIVQNRFAAWKLTPAEAEVALLTLKGFSIDETARMRNAASGTIRVQLSRVYAKSGSEDRVQFVSLFIDDLINEPLSQDAPGTGDTEIEGTA